MRKKALFILFLILWVAAVGLGEYLLLNYEKTAGLPAHAPESWPSGTLISRNPNQFTLLMFVHPHCPCTRASLEELALLMTHCRENLTAQVLFLWPGKFSEDWVKSDLWKSASRIPGVKIVLDDEGEDAKRFGTMTSGQVLLYDKNGRLLFNGGITESRGHSGDNPGRSAIESLVLKGSVGKRQTPVFGCSLMNQKNKVCPRILQLWNSRLKFCLLKKR